MRRKTWIEPVETPGAFFHMSLNRSKSGSGYPVGFTNFLEKWLRKARRCQITSHWCDCWLDHICRHGEPAVIMFFGCFIAGLSMKNSHLLLSLFRSHRSVVKEHRISCRTDFLVLSSPELFKSQSWSCSHWLNLRTNLILSMSELVKLDVFNCTNSVYRVCQIHRQRKPSS